MSDIKKLLNPTELALTQDRVIASFQGKGEDNSKFILELESYSGLFVSAGGYSALPKNNLYIRQQFILAVLYDFQQYFRDEKKVYEDAVKSFKDYIRDGVFMNGYTYFKYTLRAIEFYFKWVHKDAELMDLIKRVKVNYWLRSSQQGYIPSNDTGKEQVEKEEYFPVLQEGLFHFPDCTIYRKDNRYFYVNHNMHIYDFREDQHTNWDLGHVYYADYNLKNPEILCHNWYNNWADKSNGHGKEIWANNVIVPEFLPPLLNRLGIVKDLKNTIGFEYYWRYVPHKELPNISVHDINLDITNVQTITEIEVGKSKRTIKWNPDFIDIVDTGGSYSSCNINEVNSKMISQLEYIGENVTGNWSVGVIPNVLHGVIKGKKRGIRIYFSRSSKI